MTINISDIQILALASVEEPDWDALYRHICRQFSKTFNLPLTVVENELTEEYVLRHYYENLFYELYNDGDEGKRQQYEKIKKNIICPEVVKKEEEEDDEWAKEMNEKIAQEEKELENPNIKDINEEIDINVSVEDDLP